MIHKYKLNGFNIVVDVNSGAVHVIDDLSYEMLDYISAPLADELADDVVSKLSNKYAKQDILESFAELKELYDNELLFSSDDYEKFANMMVSAPVKAMCLHVAHDCNLRCKYCFASTGDFGVGRKLLDESTGKMAIDFLLENSKGRKNIELDFFGGEPLMNMEVVKSIVEYARSKEKEYNKNFRFTITTNGVLLNDDYIDFINKEMSNVVLSLDGRKEINDLLRPTSNQKGSYDIIVPKYQELVEKRGHDQYYVRGTFTKHNLDFAKDVMHLNELGFDQISIEPVVSADTKDYAITEKELPRIFEEYEDLAKQMIEKKKEGKGFNFFHFMLDLDQGPCAIKRLRGCGCGNEYVAVTPDGDIYPCHQFVGMEEWKMGSLYDGSFNKEMKANFAKANVYNKSECKECWAKFYCSGGCNANNLQYAGDILKPHKISCEMQKKRLECAIMMKAALA
ncbi:thioether cross-link-forming SCIFF peptide maturase [Paludicola sp. MB14-C6]|uniref:thioether cross-link-forming SCIFF peptide maturase n=1 Tax=Paludihabitans sp. MB14-C6 TaxID=3070656 RepID=UPI0027DDED75|nr:thioether cross-link-forming SCIFF peptide maturase [Paludicola sp. MB14-C6]WMJ23125.1 thioether cross-link-forming SCIFF peptide maturase [Paludicola sp. MB14-C6]